MLSESGVRQRYGDCFYHAVLWLNKNGYSVYPKGITIVTTRTVRDIVVVSTSQAIHLLDWPQRPGSARRLHILVSILETISLQKEACTKATNNVTYFRVEDDTATAVESLHFDCAVPPDKQHPICHVQNDRRHVAPPESFTHKIDATPLQARCQNIRVPTAFVNMPGLFAILAADHMSPAHWTDFMDGCLAHFQGIPALAPNTQVDKAIPKERLSTWAWYEK